MHRSERLSPEPASLFLDSMTATELFSKILQQTSSAQAQLAIENELKQKEAAAKKESSLHEAMGTQLKKTILTRAIEATEKYGRNFKAYSKTDQTHQTQHVQSDQPPPIDLVQYKFPKPMESKCDHSFCLDSMQEAHFRPIPLQQVMNNDLVVSFNRESEKLNELKLKPHQPNLPSKMRGSQDRGSSMLSRKQTSKQVTPIPTATPGASQGTRFQDKGISTGNLHWLIKNLCAPNAQIEACPIIFPETAFYLNGSPVEIVKTDNDSGNLISIKQESKLTAELIRNQFVTVVRERRKFVNRQKMAKEGIKESDEQEERQHAHDMALIRHLFDPIDIIKKPFDRIITETEFTQFFNTFKPSSREWQSVECIQTCIKAKLGLGKHFPIHYRAELNEKEESQLL